jgi:hypothetical protein
VQGGVMATNTDLTPGLVSDIDNLYSVYTTAGWNEDNWRIYAGTKPKLIKGSIEFNLPSDVDENGTMHYNKQKTRVKNDATSFVGGAWRVDTRCCLINVNMIGSMHNYSILSEAVIKW